MQLMEAKIIGYRPFSFKGNNDGKEVEMVEVYATYTRKDAIGECALRVNVSRSKFDKLALDEGKDISVIFCDKRWQLVTA